MASNRKKAAYDLAYKKQNYKRVVIDCRPEALAVLDELAAAAGLSRSAAILAAARHCLRSLSPEELRALGSVPADDPGGVPDHVPEGSEAAARKS